MRGCPSPLRKTLTLPHLEFRSESITCSYLEGWSSEEDSTLVGGLQTGACALERVCSLLESSGTDLSDGHFRSTVRPSVA